MGEKVANYQSFPANWWNFIVIQELPDSWMENLCLHLKTQSKSTLRSVECLQKIESFKPLIQAWAKDLPLRRPPLAIDQLKKSLDETLAKASLPLGLDLVSFLQEDPLGSYDDLLKITQETRPFHLERQNNYLVLKNQNITVIPLQMAYPPYQISSTKNLLSDLCKNPLPCDQLAFLGPHFASLKNQEQVLKDLEKVSIFGVLSLLAFAVFLIVSRRGKALMLTLPVLLSVSVATGITVLLFGKVHGLVLSFGSALTGLAFDYGFHGFMKTRSHHFWKSNLMGFVTTAVVFVVLAFSQIPLMQQLMVFSLVGLTLAYTLLFLLYKSTTDTWRIEPLAIGPKYWKGSLFLLIFLIGTSLYGALTMAPSFEMSQYDFQNKNEKYLTRILFSKLQMVPPLYDIHSLNEGRWPTLKEEFDFAQKANVRLINALRFQPEPSLQLTNLKAWKTMACSDSFLRFTSSLPASYTTFFSSFLEYFSCASLQKRLEQPVSAPTNTPAYLEPFTQPGKTLSLWFPQNQKESQMIQRRFPQAQSFKDLIESFPKTLTNELKWMIPLSFFLVVFIMYFYLKRWKWVFLALTPFVCGMGVYVIVLKLGHLSFSFVSLLGVIMVFGLSIDYGIFAVDQIRWNTTKSSSMDKALWSALFLAGVTSLLGFIPLVLAHHPVLLHLGLALTLGVGGTLLGVFLIVPELERLISR